MTPEERLERDQETDAERLTRARRPNPIFAEALARAQADEQISRSRNQGVRRQLGQRADWTPSEILADRLLLELGESGLAVLDRRENNGAGQAETSFAISFCSRHVYDTSERLLLALRLSPPSEQRGPLVTSYLAICGFASLLDAEKWRAKYHAQQRVEREAFAAAYAERLATAPELQGLARRLFDALRAHEVDLPYPGECRVRAEESRRARRGGLEHHREALASVIGQVAGTLAFCIDGYRTEKPADLTRWIRWRALAAMRSMPASAWPTTGPDFDAVKAIWEGGTPESPPQVFTGESEPIIEPIAEPTRRKAKSS